MLNFYVNLEKQLFLKSELNKLKKPYINSNLSKSYIQKLMLNKSKNYAK